MDIKILRNVIAGGKLHKAGAILKVGAEVTNKVASLLLADEHAAEHDGEKESVDNPKGALRMDGPTFEEWIDSGRKAEEYPPTGYADLRRPVPK